MPANIDLRHNVNDLKDALNTVMYRNYCHNRRIWDKHGKPFDIKIWEEYGLQVEDFEMLYQMERKIVKDGN
jgi:hypothetical protein